MAEARKGQKMKPLASAVHPVDSTGEATCTLYTGVINSGTASLWEKVIIEFAGGSGRGILDVRMISDRTPQV